VRFDNVLIDPLWKLVALVRASESLVESALPSSPTHLIREHHETPIGLSTQHTTHTLRSMSHRIESEKVVLLDPIVVAQELKAGFEDTRFGILVWDTAGRQLGLVSNAPAHPNMITARP